MTDERFEAALRQPHNTYLSLILGLSAAAFVALALFSFFGFLGLSPLLRISATFMSGLGVMATLGWIALLRARWHLVGIYDRTVRSKAEAWVRGIRSARDSALRARQQACYLQALTTIENLCSERARRLRSLEAILGSAYSDAVQLLRPASRQPHLPSGESTPASGFRRSAAIPAEAYQTIPAKLKERWKEKESLPVESFASALSEGGVADALQKLLLQVEGDTHTVLYETNYLDAKTVLDSLREVLNDPAGVRVLLRWSPRSGRGGQRRLLIVPEEISREFPHDPHRAKVLPYQGKNAAFSLDIVTSVALGDALRTEDGR